MVQITRTSRRRTRRKNREGAAIVELACVLPVMLILIFGSIEVCQRVYLRQSVVISAYEACRVATRQTSDTQTVKDTLQQLLEQQNIDYRSIQVRDISRSQNNLDDIETGDEIRIRVIVDWAPNVISRYVIHDQGRFTVFAHMLRE